LGLSPHIDNFRNVAYPKSPRDAFYAVRDLLGNTNVIVVHRRNPWAAGHWTPGYGFIVERRRTCRLGSRERRITRFAWPRLQPVHGIALD